jgi:crossover junction endodeoxyribonuclease RuvC
MVRVLGVDPGLRLTGYGVVDSDGARTTIVDAGVIRLDSTQSIAQRLVEIERELGAILIEHKPSVVAVEKLYAHYNHPTTAILMGHARGVMLLCVARHGARLIELPANRVKKSLTGHGHASKGQIQRSVQAHFGLKSPPEPPDVADALAVALCAVRMRTA